MATTFRNISANEMGEFLEAQGFVKLILQGVYELVWARIAKPGVSMRVYTGINPDGHSREKGTDAIRVCLFWRDASGKIVRIGSSTRVHRVEGWRGNLQARIDGWANMLGPSCPLCKAPMVLRKGRNGPFYGCATWKRNGCKGTAKAS